VDVTDSDNDEPLESLESLEGEVEVTIEVPDLPFWFIWLVVGWSVGWLGLVVALLI